MKYLYSGTDDLYQEIKNLYCPADIVLMPYWNDYKFCIYEGVNFSDLPSVDSSILDEFRDCESIFLKMADRLLPGSSYQERKDHYVRHLRYWHWRIEVDLDIAIFQNVPHEGFDFIIYSICKRKKIKTLCFYTLPIRPNKAYLLSYMTDIFNSGMEIGETYKQLKRNKLSKNLSLNSVNRLLKTYIEEHSNLNKAVIPFTRSEVNSKWSFEFLRILKLTLCYVAKLNFSKLLEKVLYRIFLYLQHRFSYYQGYRKVSKYYKDNLSIPNLSLPYIYFPLHYQPECSTSPLGGEFSNQYLVCEMLAYAAAKYNIFIYIKEHPRASKSAYIRNVEFYRKLLECKNVFLIDNSVNTYELIDKSIAVATITGSAGWESFLRLKPVLLFGSRFYESAPGVFRIKSNDDLINAIERIISKQFLHSSYEVLIFLKALESHVFQGFISEDDLEIATVDLTSSNKNFLEAIVKFIRTSNINDSLIS